MEKMETQFSVTCEIVDSDIEVPSGRGYAVIPISGSPPVLPREGELFGMNTNVADPTSPCSE